MIRTLDRRVVIVAVVLLVVVIVAGGCRSSKSTPTQESPLSPIVPSPVIPSRPPKIDPELMMVIEKGREAAPDDFVFGPNGRIRCTIHFDPNKIVVTYALPGSPPMEEQPGGQLIIRHGGQVEYALDISNSMSALMPLKNIKDLAQEDAVISIVPSRAVDKESKGDDWAAKIAPELLSVIEWEEAHPGEGQEAAPDDFFFEPDGRIRVIVQFDPNKIIVKPMPPDDEQWKEQPAVQLVTRYGMQATSAYGNEVAGLVSLERIKELAQETEITQILPVVLIEPPRSILLPPFPPSPR